MEAGRACPYDVLFVSALGRYLVLAGLLALLVAAPACSGQPEKAAGEDAQGQVQNQPKGGQAREADPLERLLATEGTDGGIGERVEIGAVSLRVFAIRDEDVVYFAPGPGQRVGVEDSGSGEFVAVDFVAQNDSGSKVTVRPEAILEDDSGVRHRRDGSGRTPNLVDGGMELEAGQKRASTLFFGVPNGTTPERLGLLVSGEEARIDLLSDERDRVPPEDYLRVYHLYFQQKAYEEAYEMYDPTSTQGVTLGDWLTFYEPLWDNRYLRLDSLTRVFVVSDEASFEMDRTFYARDGDPVAGPTLNAPVLQDMVKTEGAWKLVMGEDLVDDIVAEVPQFTPPPEDPPPGADDEETTAPESTVTEAVPEAVPEAEPETTASEPTAPELTAPEVTAPETTAGRATTASPAGDYACSDFRTQEEAQLYLAPGDPYVLDPDGNGRACETLP